MQTLKANIQTICGHLADRRIVALYGPANGKTHTFVKTVGALSTDSKGKLVTTIASKHEENFTVQILDGVEIPTSSWEAQVSAIRKQFLESYGMKPHKGLKRTHEFNRLLEDLRMQRVIPCVAMDNIELLPTRGFTLAKMFNEQCTMRGVAIGPAFLLSGEFKMKRMPTNFWGHVTEVKVGKLKAEEIENFLLGFVPQFAERFTKPAMRKLSECGTMLEMAKLTRTAVDIVKLADLEEVDDVVMAKAAKRLAA